MTIIVSVIYFISLILKLNVLLHFKLADLGGSFREVGLICSPAIVSLVDHYICGGVCQQYHWIDVLLQVFVVLKIVVLLYKHKDHYVDRLISVMRENIKIVPSCF